MDSSQFRELQAMLLESEARLTSTLSATIEAAVNKLFDERFAKMTQFSPTPTESSNSRCLSQPVADTLRVHIKTVAGELPPVELSCKATVADLKRMISHEPSVNKRRRLLLHPDPNSHVDNFDHESQVVVELVDDDQTLQQCGMHNGSGVNLVIEDFRAMNASDQRLVNSCFDIKNLKLSVFEELINRRTGCLEIEIDLLFNHTAKLVAQILKRNRTISEIAILLPQELNDAGIHSLDSILEAFESNTSNISSLSLHGNDSYHDDGHGLDRLPLKTCSMLCELFRRNANLLHQVEFREIYFDLNRLTTILDGLNQNLHITKLQFFQGQLKSGYDVRSVLCDFLVANTVITDFKLSCDELDDAEHIVRVIQYNTSITSMDLSGDIDWSSKSVSLIAEALTANTTLTYLDLGSCDRQVICGSRQRSSERSVVFLGISDLASALKRNQTLKHLFLYERRAAELDVKSLADALQHNNTLTEFDFPTFTHLFDFCTPVIYSAIVLNTSLTKLRFFEKFSSVGATSFAEAIWQSTCITDLNLSSCEFPVDGAMAFANALRTHSSLLSLNINYVTMQPVGVSAVLEAISANSVLTNLQAYSIHQLSHTYNIKSDLKCAIALLEQNTQLTCLNFGGNGCCDLADQIAAAVQKNTGLIDFSFAANYFDDRGASAFASMLLENSTLQRLDLSRNKMSRCGFQSISQALRRNTSLKYLRISSDHLTISDLDFLFSDEQLKKLHFQVDVVKQR